MEWETGEDVSSGESFLSAPGRYHVVVQDLSEPATKKDGTIIQGTIFGCTFAVAAGTVAGQEDKTVNISFFAPSLQAKDGGKMNRKKVDRFLIAVGLMDPNEVNVKKRFNLEEAIGRQLCIEFEPDKEGKYLQLKFANLYHVDDPEAKDIPKSHEFLNMIPGHLRRVGMQPLRSGAAAPASKSDGKAKMFI